MDWLVDFLEKGEYTFEAATHIVTCLCSLERLTGCEFEPMETTELQTMRGVIQASYYRCKRCKMLVMGYSDAVGTFRPRYCSNCGAKVVNSEQA